MKQIKETFDLGYGIKFEIYILQTEDGSVHQVSKKTYPHNAFPKAEVYCEYWDSMFYLDSFDNSHHRDFPIEQVMQSRISDESIPGTDTFWNHP